jgi:hypothetical protein
MFIHFSGRYCRCVTGGSNLGRTFWPSRVGLRCTQQPLYNFLEDKNIIGYSYPDDGRETQPSGLSTAGPFYMGWMHRCHWSEERGWRTCPTKSIQFTSRGGKEYPGGWIVDPSRDLPIHDPGWHRTGNFPMLTGGIVETPGSPCIIHEVVIPIPRPDGSSNLGRTFCPSRVGLRYTQQPLYNLLEDKNIMCDSYPDDARGTQPSGRSTACPFYMGWMHRRHRSEEWGVADMPNKRIQFTSRTGKEYPGGWIVDPLPEISQSMILAGTGQGTSRC